MSTLNDINLNDGFYREMYRIKQLMNIDEGVSFNPETKKVFYNALVNGCVDTKNYTTESIQLSNGLNVIVYCIFIRTEVNRNSELSRRDVDKDDAIKKYDGNPLIYALKGENNWELFDEKQKDYIYIKMLNQILERY